MDPLRHSVRAALMLASALCILVSTALFLRWWRLSPHEPAPSTLPPPPGDAPAGRHSPAPPDGGHRGIAPAYTVEELRTLGGAWAEAYGINASGQVVGQAQSAEGTYHAVLWQGGAAHDLGTLPGGSSSAARCVNGRGQIVGWADADHGAPHAFLSANGALNDLGTAGGPQSDAQSINSAGEVVGSVYVPNGLERAFLSTGGAMRDLGTLGGDESGACGVNDSGQVVGWAKTASGDQHAFVYRDGALSDLGTLGGPGSVARSINCAGEVVGCASTGVAGHAFLSTRGRMHDLGTLGGSDSEAFGVNDRGEVVGKARTPREEYHAFLHRGGRMQDLNRLIAADSGWVLVTAYGINEIGQIVGVGVVRGQRRAFLLTPTSQHRANGASLPITDGGGGDVDPAPGKIAWQLPITSVSPAGPYFFQVTDTSDGSTAVTPVWTVVPKPEAQAISGQVTLMSSGAPPTDTVIWAASDSKTLVASANIQPDGRYTLPLPPGTYLLFADPSGRSLTWWPGSSGAARTCPSFRARKSPAR